MEFVDRAVLHAKAGKGGDGCASVRREKFKPLGGPDGGNGGRGGDVVLVVDRSVTTLLDIQRHPHRAASDGRRGQGGLKAGADGADVLVAVPDGTTVTGPDGAPLADLVGEGSRQVLARGGRGGLGNAALATPRRKAPGFALLGEPGEAVDAVLELKTVADVALVGFPNAGKSSLVAALSAARPKVADYPFTTLSPNLGVVEAGDTVFTIADVPGLIPGASQGRGLGLAFLRHVERCLVLVHVLDGGVQEPERDPQSDLAVIERELAAYGGLADRPRLVTLNKVDLPAARARMAELAERGFAVFPVSAATREGLPELRFAIAERVAATRAAGAATTAEHPPRTVLRPAAVDEPGFRLERAGDGGFVVHGEKPERWVQQTDFDNDEAVGYLADRLARLGVEEELARAGAQPGVPVTIAGITFDWRPQLPAGGVPTARRLGRRGSDPRLEQDGPS